jgi:paraquat-inducible protein B
VGCGRSFQDDIMSDYPLPTAAVEPRRGRRRFSLIWIIPIVTLLIGLWLVWDTLSKRGPLLTITFDSAEGLLAGQSHIKHKEVDLGTVTAVRLTKDMDHVAVTVQLTREATPLITDQTRFWVVRPRFFAGSISGLSTLLSGSYIDLLPSKAGTKGQTHFKGLETPPVLQTDVPGRTFMLKASRVGSVTLGSPVFYRDLQVGQILGWDIGDMARSVTIHAFVRAPFDSYVHDESRFWNASGLSVKLGAEGVRIQVQSIDALLLGGIAFDTPSTADDAPPSPDLRSFPLYQDEDAADQAAFRRKIPFAAYFSGSVAGLAAGSPVNFQGIKVGQVTGIDIMYDPKTDSILTPVHFEIEPERIKNIQIAASRGPLENTRLLVQHGLRAQIQSANLITGQMQVALTIIPNAKPAELTLDGDTIVIPTVPGTFAGLTDTATALMAKVSALPFDQIGDSLTGTLQGLDKIANGAQAKQALASLAATMQSAQELVKHMDTGMSPTMKKLPALTAGLETALTRLTQVLASANAGYGDNSHFSRQLDRLMTQLNGMAQSFRALSDLLTRHPEALIRGRTGGVQ